MRVSRYAFVQAKVQGMLKKAFLGDNIHLILRLKRISDIHAFLFPGESVQLPEKELIRMLQKRFVNRSIEAYRKLLGYLPDPPPVLLYLLRRYEYRTVKSLIRRSFRHSPAQDVARRPEDLASDITVWDIGEYGTLHLEGLPDPSLVLRGTPYEWILTSADEQPVYLLENRLDRQYYEELAARLQELPRTERRALESLVSTEIRLQNVSWALRLHIYFNMSESVASELMIAVPDRSEFPEILRAFSFRKDDAEEWRSWKYAWLIEDQLTEDFRGVDPTAAERQASRVLYRAFRHMFHRHPFTVVPLYCFLRLKDFESDILQSILEGVRISVPENELLSIIGGW